MAVYSETSMNQSCSKVETFLRRIGTFDPVYFLYAFLSHISKTKTLKRTLLQTDNFFSPQIKKPPALRGKKKNLGIFEKQRVRLDIFVNFLKKETFFYTLKQQWFFWFHSTVLKECNTFDSNFVCFIPSYSQ